MAMTAPTLEEKTKQQNAAVETPVKTCEIPTRPHTVTTQVVKV